MGILKNYFKKKSKLAIVIDITIGIFLLLVLIPSTRKDTIALILKPTLFIHQPKVSPKKQALLPEAYNWQLKTLNNEKISLSDFKDKVVIINLWATWCPPCIAELPDLQRLYNDYGDKIAFMFVSNEKPGTIKSFLNKKQLTIPVYVPLSQYPSNFETRSIPTTFVINKKGEIVINRAGVAQWDSKRIRSVLGALLKEE